MNNYEYILATIPELFPDTRTAPDADAFVAELHSLLTGADNKVLDFLLSSFESDSLNEEFYQKAFRSPVRFINEYFRYDLTVRNAKVAYLNHRLLREEGTDVVGAPDGKEPDIMDLNEINSVLSRTDLLSRERGIDDLLWSKSDEITALDVFDFNLVLCAVVKMKLVERWTRLDPESGRALLRTFVDDLKNQQNREK